MNRCPCPHPPGGDLECPDDHIGICSIRNGQIVARCIELPGADEGDDAPQPGPPTGGSARKRLEQARIAIADALSDMSQGRISAAQVLAALEDKVERLAHTVDQRMRAAADDVLGLTAALPPETATVTVEAGRNTMRATFSLPDAFVRELMGMQAPLVHAWYTPSL